MTAPPTVALEVCPFCGDSNPSKYWVNGLARQQQMAYIECDLGECGARSGEFVSMDEAIAAWNQRHVATPKPVECETCGDTHKVHDLIREYDCPDCQQDVSQPSVAEGERARSMPETVVDNIRVHRVVYGLQLGLETKLDSVGLPRLVGVEPESVRLAIKLLMGLRTAQPAAPGAAAALTDAQRAKHMTALEAGAAALQTKAAARANEMPNLSAGAWQWARIKATTEMAQAATLREMYRDLAQRGR